MQRTASRSSYGNFNYRDVYGSNPYTQGLNQANQDVGNARRRVSDMEAGGFGQFEARMGDREVKDYLANSLAGQRNLLDDYVRRTAGASIKRGGMNVVGGPSQESLLHQDAMRTLASGYGQRLGEAMNYNQNIKNTRYGHYTDSLRNLQNVLGLQQNYLTNHSGWQERLGDRQRADWQSDVNWSRSEAARIRAAEEAKRAAASASKAVSPYDEEMRALELEAKRRQMEMERTRNIWEKQDRQQSLDDEFMRRNQWGRTQVTYLKDGKMSYIQPPKNRGNEKTSSTRSTSKIPKESYYD